MEDSNSVIPPRLEGEENLVVAAQHMVRALKVKKNLDDDERKILMDLRMQLLTMSTLDEKKESEGISGIQKQLNAMPIDDEAEIPFIPISRSSTMSRVNGSKDEALNEIEEHFDPIASRSKNLTNDEGKLPVNLKVQLPTISILKGEEAGETEKGLSRRMTGTKENQSYDERKISVNLRTQLPTMSTLNRNGLNIEALNVVQDKMVNWDTWEADLPRIWDYGQEKFSEYVNAEDEVWKLTESSSTSSIDESGEDRLLSLREDIELIKMPDNVLQMEMAWLEEEFRHILTLNRQTFDAVSMSWHSSEVDATEEKSIIISENYQDSNSLWGESMSRFSEGNIINLVDPDVIPHLKRIAKLMFNLNYGEQCCQAYICIRKDALDDCLFLLEMEKLSTDDAMRMKWSILSQKTMKQLRAMKIFVRGFLASEHWLCNEIFGELGSVSSNCFLETSKISMLQLVSFCEAVAVGPHQPEKLFRRLDMYEVLADLLPDIDALFSDEAAASVRMECHEALNRLADCVKPTFVELENAIASNTSAIPFADCFIHPLTRYIMNYIRTLTDYSETLNVLLKVHDKEDLISSSPDMSPGKEEENNNGISTCTVSPMALHFGSVTSSLEANLDYKCSLYGDTSPQHFFLMNNVHYMAQKVKNSELRGVLGDEWVRKQSLKFEQYATNYESATWNSILSLLKDNGLHNPSSYSVSKTLVKERFRKFYAAFEKVYKTQTAWLIPDVQLRKDLRNSITVKVIQAYQDFVGRHINDISNKYIKYSTDDLENYLLDLFEGSPRSLPNSHRR